jgi:hypothetical protein
MVKKSETAHCQIIWSEMYQDQVQMLLASLLGGPICTEMIITTTPKGQDKSGHEKIEIVLESLPGHDCPENLLKKHTTMGSQWVRLFKPVA